MKSTFPHATSVSAMLVLVSQLSIQALGAQAVTPAPQRVRTVLTTPLPLHMNGDTLRATLIAVQYGPGEASPPHSHGCPVIVYVLEGKVRSQITGRPEITYGAGDSFYEPPGGLHQVSANASNVSSARFLAVFLCDGDAPLSSDSLHAAPGAK